MLVECSRGQHIPGTAAGLHEFDCPVSTAASFLQAFDSPGYPHLATLGVDVEWNERYLLRVEGGYRPR